MWSNKHKLKKNSFYFLTSQFSQYEFVILESENFWSHLNDGLPDVQGVQDVGVGPGEALGRGLNAGPLVDLLVHATAVVFNLLKDNELRKLVNFVVILLNICTV